MTDDITKEKLNEWEAAATTGVFLADGLDSHQIVATLVRAIRERDAEIERLRELGRNAYLGWARGNDIAGPLHALKREVFDDQ